MANNRLFIYNKETNEALIFASSFDGWELESSDDAINEFLRRDDWKSAIYGGLSNLTLLTEEQLPESVVYHRYDADQKRKAMEAMESINTMFVPKNHVPFKQKLKGRKQGVIYACK